MAATQPLKNSDKTPKLPSSASSTTATYTAHDSKLLAEDRFTSLQQTLGSDFNNVLKKANGPSESLSLIEKLEFFMARGRFSEAFTCYQEIIKVYPVLSNPIFKPQTATEDRNTDIRSITNWLLPKLHESKEYEELLRCTDAALAVDKENLNIYRYRGFALFYLGQHFLAFESLTYFIAHRKNPWNFINTFAEEMVRRQAMEQFNLEDFTKALTICPNDPEVAKYHKEFLEKHKTAVAASAAQDSKLLAEGKFKSLQQTLGSDFNKNLKLAEETARKNADMYASEQVARAAKEKEAAEKEKAAKEREDKLKSESIEQLLADEHYDLAVKFFDERNNNEIYFRKTERAEWLMYVDKGILASGHQWLKDGRNALIKSWMQTAAHFITAHQPFDALKMYNKILEVRPCFLPAMFCKLSTIEKFQCKANFVRALKECPSDILILREQLKFLVNNGHFNEAYDCYQEIIKVFNSKTLPINTQQTIQDFHIINSQMDVRSITNWLLIKLHEQKKYSGLLKFAEAALVADKENITIYGYRGFALFYLEQYFLAFESLNYFISIRKNPGDFMATFAEEMVRRQAMERFNLDDFNKALALCPKDPEVQKYYKEFLEKHQAAAAPAQNKLITHQFTAQNATQATATAASTNAGNAALPENGGEGSVTITLNLKPTDSPLKK